MKTTDAAGSLAPYIRNFVGIGAGNMAYQILCSTNGRYSEAHISTSSHSFKSAKNKLKAAERLARQGWTCPTQPLCPDCSREGVVSE